jgi:tetratricopeptide (TPR) repeat protein
LTISDKTMRIVHKLDDFLYNLFPEVKQNDPQSLINAIESYFTYGPFKPKVTIHDHWVTIEIDSSKIITQNKDYQKVITLCEKGNYTDAKPILRNLIIDNPSNSEYHRIMGQILSDEGDHEEAINCLIDALRWDSKNGYALLMMGNIFSKYKNDIPTALKYYDQALIVNPNDYITINNISINLMQHGNLVEAKKYLNEGIRINEHYPNTYFALGMIAELEGDLKHAFEYTLNAIKVSKNKDVLYKNSIAKLIEIGRKITSTNTRMNIYDEYKSKLELDGNKKIDILVDNEISTAAKFEFAENYNRDVHTVKYKSTYPAIEHLIMHELVHLDLVIQARKDDLNQLFISDENHQAHFIKTLQPTINKLNQMGISKDAIDAYCSNMFSGLNSQIFNTPIDLFIEEYLFHHFIDLRPYQFLSLNTIMQEGLKAVTDKNIIEISPKEILSKSKVYNIVSALQFRELYGVDLINDFNASSAELKQATDFYNEYLQYKNDKSPGEEYELILHWAEVLNLYKHFELVNETEFRTKRANIDNLLTSIEKDPYDIESKDPHRKRDMEIFLKSQERQGTNMAVVMFMVEALNFFNIMPKDDIKRIAYDIALEGTHGYQPEKQGYTINSIKGKNFSGYHILSYFYVSWALALPEMLDELKLPYNEEYELALKLFNK